MTADQPYRLHKELRFTVNGEEFAILSADDEAIEVCETAKNGQEDCHMYAEFVKDEHGRWRYYDEFCRQQIIRHGRDGTPEALLAFVNANPVPMHLLDKDPS